jgi:hypothetical protein
MIAYYKSFKDKDINDLRDFVDNCSKLTLDAKLALQRIIQEDYNNGEFNENQVSSLDNSINESISEIKSLKLLKSLGIDLFDENGIKSIKKSNASVHSRINGIIFSSVLILFFFASLMFWVDIITVEFEIPKLIIAIIFTLIGGYGLAILLRILDRLTFYKGFLIQKDNSKIMLRYKPNLGLEQFDYSLEAKLEIESDEYVTSLNINDNQSIRTVLRFKNLGTADKASLDTMVEKFNN